MKHATPAVRYRISIDWQVGADPQEYIVGSKAEANAFLLGMDAARGWLDYCESDGTPDPEPQVTTTRLRAPRRRK